MASLEVMKAEKESAMMMALRAIEDKVNPPFTKHAALHMFIVQNQGLELAKEKQQQNHRGLHCVRLSFHASNVLGLLVSGFQVWYFISE